MILSDKKRAIIRLAILGSIALAFVSLAFINNYVVNKYKQSLYVKNIIKEPTQAVYNEISNKNKVDVQVIIPPYVGDLINETISFYDKDDQENIQKKSIIHFESTYLPSTGLLYTSDDIFDVIAICDGQVLNIEKDNILGNHITIKHSDNLIVHYYSLSDVDLKQNDIVTQGQILGTSDKNKISKSNYNLFFEVTYQGELINPNKIYNQKITNFS